MSSAIETEGSATISKSRWPGPTLRSLRGGVSSIPAAIAVWALARPPVFAAYLGFATLGAFTLGIGYGLVG